MRNIFLIIAVAGCLFNLNAQSPVEKEIAASSNRIDSLNDLRKKEIKKLESLKLSKVADDLRKIGYPKTKEEVEVVEHQAMVLGYDEKHEQARWVAHIVTPDIIEGNVSRTNDFRVDPKVSTKTAEKADYWYSGYDRGHLAPSADFRWSQSALSESYFYSNMAPQRPELNRERWAELENLIRDYVITNNRQVYVVTGGVLTDGLETMKNEGRKNEVSIPKYFYKVILDNFSDKKTGIGFILPNGNCPDPLLTYAVPIDSVEALTGLDFFGNLPNEDQNEVEPSFEPSLWRSKEMKGEALPLNPETLGKGKINTLQAKYHLDSKMCVCGTVVSTKYSSKSGATFMNLDKKFPNQIFSITIWKKSRVNFSYRPEEELKGKKICVTGFISEKDGTPTMNLTNEKSVIVLD